MFKYFFIFLFFISCSSYRFGDSKNPLSHYEIKSLSIPMFYNFSNFPDLSGDFTRETYRLMSRFNGLKIISGYDPASDAVLLGVLRTQERTWDSNNPKNLRVAQAKARESIGNSRQSFYVPGSSEIDLVLQVLIIKKPTAEDFELLKTGLGDSNLSSSRIVLNQKISLKGLFNRELLDAEGTQVVGTQNSGVQRRTLETLAVNAALSIRDIILYAY